MTGPKFGLDGGGPVRFGKAWINGRESWVQRTRSMLQNGRSKRNKLIVKDKDNLLRLINLAHIDNDIMSILSLSIIYI